MRTYWYVQMSKTEEYNHYHESKMSHKLLHENKTTYFPGVFLLVNINPYLLRKQTVLFLYGRYRVRKESIGGLILCNNQSFQAVNSYSAKFLKNHLEMEWVDLWQLL